MSGSPNTTGAVRRPDLRGAVAEEWNTSLEMESFVANQVLPVGVVANKAATYKAIGREVYTKNTDTDRAPGGKYNRADFGDKEKSYATSEQGLEVAVDDSNRQDAANYFDAEMVATRISIIKPMRNHEIAVAAQLFNAANFAGFTSALGTPWSTVATSTPIDDVKAKVLAIQVNCGLPPEMIDLTVNPTVFKNLTESVEVLSRINGGATTSQPAKVLRAILAELMGIRSVIVAGAVADTANPGKAYAGGFLWSPNFALLSATRPNPSLFTLQLGSTLSWSDNGSNADFITETYRDETTRGDVVRSRRNVVADLQYPECGWLFSNVT